MTTTTTFSFQHRPLVPFAHDYAHGDQEDWHQHDCAQLLHILSGVLRVATPAGYWVVPPGRGVWLPAGTPHALRMTGNVAARTLFIDPLARADSPGGLPDRTDHAAAAGTDRLIPGTGRVLCPRQP
ncbi:AraC family transcriptional regulator [Klebsiella aerogenes]|nr:AraC family transcriptional regulator [Klebsiella aerogenes]